MGTNMESGRGSLARGRNQVVASRSHDVCERIFGRRATDEDSLADLRRTIMREAAVFAKIL
ncbi:hypothetical protein CR51_23100 [Caballeronia megalochromosomata]|nr:hypothetical protein CR51_23100 [Caballeronia megalochromosomata]